MKARSIQQSMIVGFTALIVLTIATLGALSFYLFGDTIRRISLDNTSQVVAQLNRVIDSYISYMDDISRVVIYDNDVQRYIREPEGLNGASEPSDPALRDKIGSFFRSIISVRKDVDSIILLRDDGGFVTDEPGDRLNPYSQRREAVPSANSTLLPSASLSSSHVEDIVDGKYPWVITLRSVVHDERTNVPAGTLLVNLNYGVIEGLCDSIQLGKSGYVFIINQAGDIVYHPRQQLVYSGLKREAIDLVRHNPNSHLTVRVDGTPVLYTTTTSQYTGWTIVGVSNLRELFSNRRAYEYYFAIVALFCFLAAVIVASFISVGISRPIEALRRSVQSIERGNFDIDVRVDSTDEVNGLARDFDIAIKKIKDLIVQNTAVLEQKRMHELKALQAQINPHFLYNTLDSIIWMIECGDNDDAITMTSTLARFFRLGISKGGDIITVGNEIDHLNCYLTIQKMRYKDRLDYSVDVSPDIYSYRTLKLLIQPLVENSIYHGLRDEDRSGMVTVVGYKSDDDLVFKVVDNGAGMSVEELSRLYGPGGPSDGLGGIGVSNVHERIQLYFGAAYGVSFESQKGRGTTATIRLPASLDGAR